MSFELFLLNLNRLSSSLHLKAPLLPDRDGYCLLAHRGKDPLTVSLYYDDQKGVILLKTVLNSRLPSSVEDIQHFMNEIVSDLFARKKNGRLTADPENACIYFTRELLLDPENPELLSDVFPLFLQEAQKWHSILKKTLFSSKDAAEEILLFRY